MALTSEVAKRTRLGERRDVRRIARGDAVGHVVDGFFLAEFGAHEADLDARLGGESLELLS